MNSRMERFFIAVMFALLAAGITLVAVSAQEDAPPAQDSENQCVTCHTEFQMTWESGLHGQSGSDPLFVEQWTAQGKPGACLVCHTTGYDPATATYKSDGVSCEACHEPAPADHPRTPMPIDHSTDLCGRCHSDTRFGWQDWKVSAHYQRGMDCATCHDPHSASLKRIAGPRGVDRPDEVSELCINCHNEYSMEFSYTSHHQQGISCVDCHVKHLESSERTPHTVPDHSFNASLDSCNTCHAQQMHSPTDAINIEGTVPASGISTAPQVRQASVTPEPTPINPLGYAGLAGLIGLAVGMLLAPWLERWYRLALQRAEEVKHE